MSVETQMETGESAEQLIVEAERTPVFRYRQAPQRALIERASALLAGAGRADLESRCLLRLAEVELDARPQVALESAEEAERRSQERRVECLCVQSRALRRLGRSEEADARLRQAAGAPSPSEASAPSRAASQLVALTLALADQQTARGAPEVVPTLRGLLNFLDTQRLDAPDARFQAHLQIALALRLENRVENQLKHLRRLVSLVKAHDAPADLLEARLALGTALAAAHENAEARRVLQAVIDQARDLDDEHIRLLGLVGMTAVLADSGAVQGAVSTAIQSSVGYAKRGDLLGYLRGITLAAQVLLRNGHDVRAVELLMFGEAALQQTMGEEAARLLSMQLEALRAEWGEARYESVCRKLLEVRAARRRLQES